jgi:hypothetical protein
MSSSVVSEGIAGVGAHCAKAQLTNSTSQYSGKIRSTRRSA